ncbi:MAG: DUF4349 domain-containing protein [Flavobacterium sp.]|uniref:DUF4349 domain-containing protein n=1 Tax=Flavobacterium sp. TaxID=239 RepID=UPI0011F9A366|nr:DUF4349 domain-containing protein [Flavobacterium sp.]RZJ65837.1 MAG: DUF4349 domain-containing protein [Flavobacterium sp.]
MKTNSLLGLAIACALLASCKQSEMKTEESVATSTTEESLSPAEEISGNAKQDKKTSNNLSSSAAVEKNDGKHKFVRTADIRFKVKDVAKSTNSVEDVVSQAGGFVVSTELKSDVNKTEESKMSEDSIVKTTQFTVYNDMIIRVPNTNLDAALKTISKEVGYLDYRIIKAEDVALQLKSNQLAQKRLARHQQRVEDAVDSKGKKLNQINDTENDLLDKQATSDSALLDNLALEDKVAYSTVALKLYQDETVRREVLANFENAAFRTPFGTRLLDSLKTGWYILEGIITFALNFWPFLIAGLGVYLGLKKYGKRRQTAV